MSRVFLFTLFVWYRNFEFRFLRKAFLEWWFRGFLVEVNIVFFGRRYFFGFYRFLLINFKEEFTF